MKSLLILFISAAASGQSAAELRRGFEHPPDDARIMVRWWWFGPAVTKPELEREMRAMKEGGIGGFEVQPVYPLEVEGNFPYLSDEFLDACASPARRRKELGLRLDLTLGSGWPYGGPHIPIDRRPARLRVSKTEPALARGREADRARLDAAGRLRSCTSSPATRARR